MRYPTTLILAALWAAAPPVQAASTARLSNVIYADGVLKIQMSAPTRYSTTLWKAGKRFCVDLDASGIDLQLRQLPVFAGRLKTVRWNQWKPDSVRVVLDLTSAEAPVVMSSPPTDLVEVRVAPPAVQTPTPPSAADASEIDDQTPTPPGARAQIGDIVVDRDDSGRPSRVTVHTDNASGFRDSWGGNHLAIDLADAAPAAERIIPVNDQVVLRVRTGAYKGHGRVIIDTSQRFGYKLQPLDDGKGFALDILLPDPGSPAPAPVPDEAPLTGDGLQGKLIVLDPGHGGHDTGARGLVTEKVMNLDIALRLRDALQKMGARVTMTRDDDTFVPLTERPALAMKLGADAFVSIHCNYARSLAGGTEVFYRRNDAESRRLATCLYNAHRAQTGLWGRKVKPDSGAPQGGLAVLKHNSVACALVEVAFVNNPVEGKKLASPTWRQGVAEALAQGLERYMEGRS